MSRIVVVVILWLVLAPSASAWTWPVEGEVLRGFLVYDSPYTAGQHRGVDLAVEPGRPVRAPAAGAVTFAGTVPHGGRTLTIRTADGYSVTLQHLGAFEVARGAVVAEGAVVAAAGSSGEAEHAVPSLHLGIRRTDEEHGYVDPLALLPAAVPAAVPEPAAVEPAPVPVAAPVIAPATTPAPPAAAPASSPVDTEAVATAEPAPVPAEAVTAAEPVEADADAAPGAAGSRTPSEPAPQRPAGLERVFHTEVGGRAGRVDSSASPARTASSSLGLRFRSTRRVTEGLPGRPASAPVGAPGSAPAEPRRAAHRVRIEGGPQVRLPRVEPRPSAESSSGDRRPGVPLLACAAVLVMAAAARWRCVRGRREHAREHGAADGSARVTCRLGRRSSTVRWCAAPYDGRLGRTGSAGCPGRALATVRTGARRSRSRRSSRAPATVLT